MKQILAVSALAVASTSAFADTALPSSGNGELVLYVFDATQDTSYGRGLGVDMNNIISNSQILANGATATAQSLNSFNLGTIAPDANMAAYLSTIHSGDTVEWAVLGGDSLANSNTLGAERYATTTVQNLSNGTTVTNSAIRSGYSNLIALQTTLNGFIGTNVVNDKSSTQPQGVYGTSQTTAPTWFGNGNINNAIAGLGTTANFYLIASGGGATSHVGQVYSMYTLTLGTDGTLSMNAPVTAATPIPAALWLLGSGLAGLVGIGRRKQA